MATSLKHLRKSSRIQLHQQIRCTPRDGEGVLVAEDVVAVGEAVVALVVDEVGAEVVGTVVTAKEFGVFFQSYNYV